jgi:uncharacterized protein YndB with AHSA1/START domain
MEAVTEHFAPKPYEIELAVNAPRDEVWDALTQPPVLRQWFGWDYEGLDAEIQQIFVDEATLVSPERMGWDDGSYLEVTGDDRSVVRAVRAGATPEGDDYDALEEGWRAFLLQLRFLLEERPKGPRRTIYLSGSTTWRQAREVAGGPLTPFGPRLGHRVDSAGHFLVVAGHEPLTSADAGHVDITVSTFGLDDAAFAVVRDSWEQRWAPAARDAEVTIAQGS